VLTHIYFSFVVREKNVRFFLLCFDQIYLPYNESVKVL